MYIVFVENKLKHSVKHIAQNAGHTTQKDGSTMQNVGHTMHYVSCNTLNVCQGPKGGFRCPQGAPLPLYLKKLQCLEMSFRTLGTKKIKSDN